MAGQQALAIWFALLMAAAGEFQPGGAVVYYRYLTIGITGYLLLLIGLKRLNLVHLHACCRPDTVLCHQVTKNPKLWPDCSTHLLAVLR